MFTLASPLFQVQAQVDGAHRGVFILRNVQYMAFTAPLLSEYNCPQIAEFSTYSWRDCDCGILERKLIQNVNPIWKTNIIYTCLIKQGILLKGRKATVLKMKHSEY